MENKFKIYPVFIIFIIILAGCNNSTTDPEPDKLQLQLEKLMNANASWDVVGGSVIKDGYDVTSQFNGFVLTIGEFTFATQNSVASAWSNSGTWQFNADNPNKILRNDDVLIDINLSDNKLTLSFTVSGLSSGGRQDGIGGEYIFNLVSQ